MRGHVRRSARSCARRRRSHRARTSAGHGQRLPARRPESERLRRRPREAGLWQRGARRPDDDAGVRPRDRRHGLHLLAGHRRCAPEPRRAGPIRAADPAADPVPGRIRPGRIPGTRSTRDTGRVPCQRTRTDRLDRRLRRERRRASGTALDRTWRRARRAAGATADRTRVVLRGDGRPGSSHRPRPHPVAAPELLRLLPVEQLVPVDPRRAPHRGHRRAGHELDHLAGVHRTRNADARLDDRAARPAPRIPLDERARWRGHPGLGQRGGAGGHPRRALEGDRRGDQRRRRHVEAGRLRHLAGAFEHREGPAHRRHRHRPDPHGAARRRVRDACPTPSTR